MIQPAVHVCTSDDMQSQLEVTDICPFTESEQSENGKGFEAEGGGTDTGTGELEV
jgi:hypothetical protein